MKTRLFHANVLLWAVALAFTVEGGCEGGCQVDACGASESASRPNVLFVTLDTTRHDRLGFYGSDLGLTPTLDELASEGVVFMDARTEVPITLPSHTTMLTGQGIRQHGIRENGVFQLADSATTWTELMKEAGYNTGAFVSSFVLDARFGLAQGFDTYDDEMTAVNRGSWQGHQATKFERQGHQTTERALDWLARQRGERPFFAWVHYYDPHSPYRAPKRFKRDGRHKYDAEVAFMDHQFSRVLEAARDVDENTLVVVASDHGQLLGEHGRRGHGDDIYEPAMRTALLMAHPELLPAGARVETRVRLAGIGSTVLDLLDIDKDFPGPSLASVMREKGSIEPADPLYMESVLPKLRSGRSAVHGVLSGDYKLHVWPDDDRVELYNLANDPEEETDLSDKLQKAQELRKLVDELVPNESEVSATSAKVHMDEETRAKLEALGYIDG